MPPCEGAARDGPPRSDQHPAKDTDTPLASTLPDDVSAIRAAAPVDELAARRELRSWAAATRWLNAHGYAAAVPGHLVALLAARGVTVWGAGREDAA